MIGNLRFPRAELYPVYYKRNGTMLPIPNRNAVVGDTGEIYAIVSDRYELLLHEEAYEIVKEVLEKLNMETIREEVKFSRDGGFMQLTICLMEVEVADGDVVGLGFNVFNSYDKSSALRFDAGGIRYVCANGMVIPFKGLIGRIRKMLHFKGVICKPNFDDVKKTVETIAHTLLDLADLLKIATKETVSNSDLVHFIETTFSNVPTLREKIYSYLKHKLGINLDDEIEIYRKLKGNEELIKFFENVENEKYNLWDVYNAFTDVLSHTRRVDLRTTVNLQEKAGLFLIQHIRAR